MSTEVSLSCELQRLRYLTLLLAVSVTGGVTAQPTVIYDDNYWNSVRCDEAPKPVLNVCLESHARAKIAPNEIIEKEIPTLDETWASLDSMLARALKDPTSPMQYQVSGLLPCTPTQTVSQQQRGCVCYSINSKNSYGAYTGARVGVAEILAVGHSRSFIALPIPDELVTPAVERHCIEGGLRERDAGLIKAKVH